MLNSEKIAGYLERFRDIGLSDLQMLFALSKERSLKAGERYIDDGTSSRRLAYVKQGLIRVYQVREQGDERTVLLRWEDQFFASYDTILSGRPSRFIYEAFEDTVLLEADYEAFMRVIDARPNFAAAKTFFLQEMLAEALERVEGFILFSPEERYLRLLEEKPDLARRIPSKYLASLLGITPVSLSRIRNRIAHRKH